MKPHARVMRRYWPTVAMLVGMTTLQVSVAGFEGTAGPEDHATGIGVAGCDTFGVETARFLPLDTGGARRT